MAQEKIKNKWLNGVFLEGLYTFDEAIKAVENLEGQRITNNNDLKELFDNTTFSFDKETKEGVFTFKDGTEIRFPAEGYQFPSDKVTHNQGESGYYWSSFVPSDNTNASCMLFNSAGKLGAITSDLDYGFSVRCVKEKVTNI